MKILITGITGMVGSHLADYVLKSHPGVEVHGIVRWRSPLDNIRGILPNVTLHHADLLELTSLVGVFKSVRPDRVFHLAAQSFVPDSFILPSQTAATNYIGTINLLEAVKLCGLDPKIHVCSSSEVYGQVSTEDIPIKEQTPFRPASPYAVSKVAADLIAYQYHASFGLKTIRTRMFTHTGPRRGDVFAESSFAKQIAEIESGVKPNPVLVGNLDSVRTVVDVRDAVRAYWLLLERCTPGEVYNIGGDQPMTVGEILETLKRMATCTISHRVDPSLMRPSDVTLQIPDSGAFRKATGWEPEIPPEQTLGDLLNYHRARIRATQVSSP